MTTRTRAILLTGILLAMAMQFIRPSMTNPESDPALSIWSDATLPTDIGELLRQSCADCHSHDTEWPWYAQIAPGSWLVARDVDVGRRHLNLSTWAQEDAYRRLRWLEEIGEEVSRGDMPLPIYTPLHPEARLDESERERIRSWAAGVAVQLRGELED